MTELNKKVQRLEHILRQHGKIAIAFSGGADSSLLAAKALNVLGPENVLLLTARSCLLKQADIANAANWLDRHGYGEKGRHQFIEFQPLSWPEFVRNPPDRCYVCKLRVYRAFIEHMASTGIRQLVDGTNFDDLHSDRPGLRALQELQIGSPLAEAGLCKEEVRSLSHAMGVDTWDRPSASCLATRIPGGLSIAEEHLAKIEQIESFLESSGFTGCRARLDPAGKKIIFLQVKEDDLVRIAEPSIRSALYGFLSDFGIKEVFLDLQGR